MAIGSADHLVSLWDLDDLVCHHNFTLDSPVRALSFNGEGTFIAAACESSVVQVSDSANGECVARVDTKAPISGGTNPALYESIHAGVNVLSWHPKLNIIAVGTEGGSFPHQVRELCVCVCLCVCFSSESICIKEAHTLVHILVTTTYTRTHTHTHTYTYTHTARLCSPAFTCIHQAAHLFEHHVSSKLQEEKEEEEGRFPTFTTSSNSNSTSSSSSRVATSLHVQLHLQ